MNQDRRIVMRYIVILNNNERDLLIQDLYEMSIDEEFKDKDICKNALHKLIYSKQIDEDCVKRVDYAEMKAINNAGNHITC